MDNTFLCSTTSFYHQQIYVPGDWLQLVTHPVQMEEAGLHQPLPGGGAGLHQLAPLIQPLPSHWCSMEEVASTWLPSAHSKDISGNNTGEIRLISRISPF